jgi:hypothetical protein
VQKTLMSVLPWVRNLSWAGAADADECAAMLLISVMGCLSVQQACACAPDVDERAIMLSVFVVGCLSA